MGADRLVFNIADDERGPAQTVLGWVLEGLQKFGNVIINFIHHKDRKIQQVKQIIITDNQYS